MARWLTLAGAVVVMGGVAFACGGDDDSGTGGASGSGASGTGGTAGSGGGQQNVECDPSGDGVCENENDCPIVSSGEARTAAQDCGIGCVADADPDQCASDCVVAESGLSVECAACYVGIVTCSRENCLTQCLGDAAGMECMQCQVDAGCRAAFDECSGLPPIQ
jgi:hypothetical protein